MAKLYSFQWNDISGVFFKEDGTTWWPLSWVGKTFSIPGSTTSVLKKFGVVEHEKKRFQAFQIAYVPFPKNTYFISQEVFERMVKDSGGLEDIASFFAFLAEPENIQEITKKLAAPKKVSEERMNEETLTELIFELLTFTKALTIALQMQEPLSKENKGLGRRVIKKLTNLL